MLGEAMILCAMLAGFYFISAFVIVVVKNFTDSSNESHTSCMSYARQHDSNNQATTCYSSGNYSAFQLLLAEAPDSHRHS